MLLSNMVSNALIATMAVAVILGNSPGVSAHEQHEHHHHHHHHRHAATAAAAGGGGGRCQFSQPDEKKIAINTKIQEMKKRRAASPILCTGCITIKIYSYVVESSDATRNFLTQDIMDLQLQVINENFADSPFRFIDAGTQFIVNDRYVDLVDDTEETEYAIATEVGMAYNQGGWADVNAYYSVGWGNFAAFNAGFQAEPGNLETDNVFVNAYTLPGLDDANLGYTLTHEVGHWLGLEHPFELYYNDENGPKDPCGPLNLGDFVDDTVSVILLDFARLPVHQSAAFGRVPY
jgi:hypothetical protein